MASDPVFRRYVKATLVQRARGWTTDNSGWFTVNGAQALNFSDGTDQELGTATIVERIGMGIDVGDMSIGVTERQYGMLEDAKWVRILLEADVAGAITAYGPDGIEREWDVAWTGFISGYSLTADPGSTLMRYTCLDPRGLLDRIFITSALVEDQGGGTSTINRAPIVNEDAYYGNATPNPDPTWLATVFKFPTGETDDTERWTALALVKYLLRFNANPIIPGQDVPTGTMPWRLAAGDALLGWEPIRFDLHGRSVFEVLNDLCGRRRGLTWTATYDAQGGAITVKTVAPEAISIGGVSIPAATMTDFDATDSIWIDGPHIAWDDTAADVILVTGDNPVRGVTFSWNQTDGTGSLAPWRGRWTKDTEPAQLYAPNFYSVETLVDSVFAFRRFQISDTWDGLTYGSTTDGVRTQVSDADDGFPDGNRTWTGTGFDPLSLRLVTDLVWRATATTSDPAGLDKPRVFIGTPGVDEWEDWSDLVSVTVMDDPPAIDIDDGAGGWALHAALQGRTLLVSIGVREPDPIIVGWRRPAEEWPHEVPRVLLLAQPQLGSRSVCAEAITQLVVDTGQLQPAGANTLGWDFTDIVRQVAVQAGAYHGRISIQANWSERGINVVDFAPGSVVGDIITQHGSDGRTWTVRSCVSRRTVDLSSSIPTTTWDLRRPAPDLGAMVTGQGIDAARLSAMQAFIKSPFGNNPFR